MIQEEQKKEEHFELVPCERCGRKFLPDRLAVHSKVCKGKKETVKNNYSRIFYIFITIIYYLLHIQIIKHY